ncbi:MAG TPA: PTS system mannose/fructose/sorbose family transporter subunit IID [Nocardioides sp.]|jgi:mannose/fructose/N-acetylgalactosamine-specific phosphotransferase system component IID|nr:PTS system mannose/fructose/sorbose family transporter subunit IID [Nocardioides sp.]
MSDTQTLSGGDRPADAPAPVLTKRDLNKSFWRMFFSFQISWNYERMQALGFAWAMQPVLRKIYPDKEEYAEGLQRHLSFFNTSPIIGAPLIVGSAIAMEEAKAKTSAEGVKVGLMGPMAGVGDSLTFALYNSIIFTIAANWAIEGKLLGFWFACVMVLVPYFLVRRWQFFFAYQQGKNLASQMAGGALERLSEAATILGLVVLGGFIPSIVKIWTTLTYHQTVQVQGKSVEQKVPVQAQLDQVVPYLMPVVLTGLIYWLMKKFNLHPLWAIVIVFALGLALGWKGWFTNVAPASGS